MNQDRECPQCKAMRFSLLPVPPGTLNRAINGFVCAACLGLDDPEDFPSECDREIKGSAEEGWYRLRRTPWPHKGVVPIYEYKPPTSWTYPSTPIEVEVDCDSVVRVVALEQMTKYGYVYEIVYVNRRRRMTKKIGFARSIPDAQAHVELMVEHIRQRKRS